MLQFYYDFIDKHINREDFELTEMDTDSNSFSFSEDSIDKLINPQFQDQKNQIAKSVMWDCNNQTLQKKNGLDLHAIDGSECGRDR